MVDDLTYYVLKIGVLAQRITLCHENIRLEQVEELRPESVNDSEEPNVVEEL